MILTFSICDTCYKRVPADIFVRDGAAWITKTCDVHGTTESLVDPDASLMLQHYNTSTLGHNKAILVPITPDCNMSCSWCFTVGTPYQRRSADYYDRSLLDYKQRGFTILLSGGEPTTRPDFIPFVRRLQQLGWPVVTMSNMLAFADPLFMGQSGLLHNGLLHADFSMQHPKNYDGEVATTKYAALANLERLGAKVNCIQFSVSDLDELEWIRKFYNDTRQLYRHIRIRTLYGFGADGSEKIYLSQLYKRFIEVFGDLTPVADTSLETSNMYSLYMRDAYCGISLSSSPTVHNVDLLNACRPTYGRALDGKCYSFPVAQIIDQGIRAGWYNGFRIKEVTDEATS